MDRAASAVVIGDLRRARRRQRVAEIHWIDAMYQVYITGVIAIIALVAVSSAIGDGHVASGTVDDVIDIGPTVVGGLLALAVMLGLRSGSRGGPLALERADVRHVLLAPVDRGVALRGPALRQLRFLAFVGSAVGACIGQLALRRLPGNGAGWVLCGAALGLVAVGLYYGSALVASGLKLPRPAATGIGGALVLWSIAELADRAPTAAGTIAGRLAVWPLEVDLLALAGPALAVALIAVGFALVPGTSLEAVERRTALVGQLRFAVTLQDLRTVLVLRRQLAQERPRSRPWIPARTGHRARRPVFQRGLRSILRWPVSRIFRVLVLIVTAGLGLRGAWGGTTPFLVLSGLALWLAALDAAEPLGQEVDHPGRTDTFPVERGALFAAHLPLIGVVTAVIGLLAGAVAAAPIGGAVPVGPAMITGLIAGLLAGCGAVVSVVQGAPSAVDSIAISTPEIAGTRTVLRTAFPPGLAVAGALPILAARAAEEGVGDPTPESAAAMAAVGLGIVAVLCWGWVRKRDDITEFLRSAAEEMSPTKALERSAEARTSAEEREAAALAESRRIAGLEPEGSGSAPAKAPKPKPAPKSKPKPADPAPGVQGGKSAKPIGRKRDQKP